MNKIHNHLGDPKPLTIKDIVWEVQSEPGYRRKRNLSVPTVQGSVDDKAARIWNCYFKLLFHRFDIMGRLVKEKSALNKKANDLYQLLFQKDGSVNRDGLLDILIKRPDHNKSIITKANIKSNVPIVNVFDYDTLTGKTYQKEFTTLVQMLSVNVCPYCGRNFTTTIQKSAEGYARTCQIDHFFPQSTYPWLAVSLLNLIPSCGFCNNRKKDREPDILYPYKEEIGEIYRFRTHPIKGMSYLVGAQNSEEDFQVSLEPTLPLKADEDLSDYEILIENEISLFKINELYSSHNGYVANIFRQRYVFGIPYIDSLVSSFGNLFHSREDVRAMLYFKRIDNESIGENPLDRLTRDIDHEIDLLE